MNIDIDYVSIILANIINAVGNYIKIIIIARHLYCFVCNLTCISYLYNVLVPITRYVVKLSSLWLVGIYEKIFKKFKVNFFFFII